MASKVSIKCPFCGNNELWDNRATKSGKQPDFKCTSKACNAAGWISKDNKTIGFSCDGEKKRVDFKETPVEKTQSAPKTTYASGKKVDPGFFSAWAKDLAVASIEKDIVKADTVDDVFDVFKGFYDKFDNLLNASSKTAAGPSDTVDVAEDTVNTDDMNLDDLDLDLDID